MGIHAYILHTHSEHMVLYRVRYDILMIYLWSTGSWTADRCIRRRHFQEMLAVSNNFMETQEIIHTYASIVPETLKNLHSTANPIKACSVIHAW